MQQQQYYDSRVIPVDHKDIIHDVAYDFYGRRMATCSSDQSVKVWDLKKGEWHCTANWKTHSGSVWRVDWAHPEFGQLLVTCSFDRTAAVWEEQISDAKASDSEPSHWAKKASLVDSRTSVTDVKFAPKHLGLMLATCSADGTVRIYEAPDVMNLSQWSLMHEIVCKACCSCISWNPSRIHPPMIAVGSDETALTTLGKVLIFEYNESSRKWNRIEALPGVSDPVHGVAFAPNLGRQYHMLAVASKDIRVFQLVLNGSDPSGQTKLDVRQPAQFDQLLDDDHASQVWRVQWNVTGTTLASSGNDGCVRLWKANYLENWKCIAVLKGDGVLDPSDPTHKKNPPWLQEVKRF
ncbi:nucleoporin SEH1-like [Oscarella lobularis]|uniref:nucleoporin SEH1-like n=1 Tax=Oscarella lobularis TaxID=121494 RepID=UPI0033143CF0